LQLSGDLETGA